MAGTYIPRNLKSGSNFWQANTQGEAFYLDPTKGSAGADGEDPDSAESGLVAAYALLTGDQHDTLWYPGGDTSADPATAITWAKDFCYFIGENSGLPGMGQRSRIVNTAANDLATAFTVSGKGNVFSDLQFFDGKDKAEDGANVLVSGGRNSFIRCFFAGMGASGGTAPATRAGSYSLKVSGEENYFYKSTIGLDTIVRSAANSELIVSGPRNTFEDCTILSNSVTAGKFLVKIDNALGDLRTTTFLNCRFINYSTNWATGITNAFSMPAGGSTHSVYLDSRCGFMGVGMGVADNLTHIYGTGPAPNAGFGIALNPTT